MKIKSQFIVCIAVFSIILVVIAASVANTEQQVAQVKAQEEITTNIERSASGLNSIAIDYFLYQEDLQLARWESSLSALSGDVANLTPSNQQQQTLVNNVESDMQRLNALFNDVVVYLQTASRNVSVRIDPAFQLRWSSMAVQGQALAFDASQLSSSLNEQARQVNITNTILIVSLVGAFGALLATIYLLVFRRTLKSVGDLQKGISTIGSGNFEYVIETKQQDEISELSRAFNQMTINLKTVTASKTELETEICLRKQAEISLRESEQRWETTLASIGDAVIATDLSGKITFMNGVSEELTGWTLVEAREKPIEHIFNIINEQTRKEVENPVSKVLEKGVIVGLANHTVLIRKDKTEVAIDDSGAPIKDKEGKTLGVVLIFRDIGERKLMEAKLEEYSKYLENILAERTKQLKDSERLAAIGATAGMVGHDIRNPLQAITSDVYLAKTDLAGLPESEEKTNVQEGLAEIEKNIYYINKIVTDLQDFARPLTPKIEDTDLEATIHSALAHLKIPGNVTVKHSIRKDFPKLKTDQSYIQRILTNLANNAIQAMPNGGKLTIAAAVKNDKATITVQDTGEGIPEEVRGKLFTPLVTTKSKGQGFGLSVVKRFTEALSGTVTYESEVGKGTKFIIELPL
jgi:PAS domain S-box-containing protein